MDRAVSTDTPAKTAANPAAESAPRMFTVSMLVSGIRCLLAYVALPFITPFLGLAPGVGPALGVVIGVVAIAANVWSIRRFWVSSHPWRKPVIAINMIVIALMLVLIAMDLSDLIG